MPNPQAHENTHLLSATVLLVLLYSFSFAQAIGKEENRSDSLHRQAEVKTLKAVAVRARKPLIRQQADRIIYDLSADPESKGSSLLDMMRKVPYISLDGNNNVLLKGNSSFKVLINGKPSDIVENNLKTILQSMPASTIQRIEVITIPPSKYDAEGLAGIINIINKESLCQIQKGRD